MLGFILACAERGWGNLTSKSSCPFLHLTPMMESAWLVWKSCDTALKKPRN